MALFRDGESACRRRARPARRDSSTSALMAVDESSFCRRGRKPLRSFRDGRSVRTGRGSVLGAGDGGGSYVGDVNQEWPARLHISFRLFAWYVHAAGGCRIVQWDGGASAEGG